MDFTQLYTPAQVADFSRVRAALIADPKALDNRGPAAPTVDAIEEQANGH